MAQFTLSLVLVASLLSYCSAENVYCVTPTATSCSSCPHNSANCTTLSEYAHEAELYFTSNTTLVFLLGDHVLDRNITVANVTRLTMHGEWSSSGNTATVVCTGSFFLIFTSTVDLKIHLLAFTSFTYHALSLYSTQRTELVNCSFHGNHGTALVVNNTDITLAGITEFKHNRACGINVLGGAIIASNSNLTFNGNTTFLDNSATSGQCQLSKFVFGGGAIFTSGNTVLNFSGTNNFFNNSAFSGGAIYADYNTVLSFNGANNFINNSAHGGGGAITTLGNTVLSFRGTSNVINNSAVDEAVGVGGAIYTLGNAVLSFSGASNFFYNSADNGGAIYILGNAVLIDERVIIFYPVLSFSGTSNFINNSADNGGTIYADNYSKLSFNGTVNFTNNICSVDVNGDPVGGGVYMGLQCTFSILPNTTVYWENNHATL